MAEQQCVRDVMAPPEGVVQASQTLAAARQRMMGDTRIKSLIVADGDRAVGMVRYNDISHESAALTVADVTLREVPTVSVDDALQDLTGIMTQYDIDRLAVVDESGTIVGELPRASLTLAETTTSEGVTAAELLSDAQANQTSPVYSVRQDMTVVGTGGGKIGKVKEVMTDSLSGSLTHIVVHTGLIFGKDKSIPADLIDNVEGDEVCLKVDKSEVNMLPDMSAEA